MKAKGLGKGYDIGSQFTKLIDTYDYIEQSTQHLNNYNMYKKKKK